MHRESKGIHRDSEGMHRKSKEMHRKIMKNIRKGGATGGPQAVGFRGAGMFINKK